MSKVLKSHTCVELFGDTMKYYVISGQWYQQKYQDTKFIDDLIAIPIECVSKDLRQAYDKYLEENSTVVEESRRHEHFSVNLMEMNDRPGGPTIGISPKERGMSSGKGLHVVLSDQLGAFENVISCNGFLVEREMTTGAYTYVCNSCGCPRTSANPYLGGVECKNSILKNAIKFDKPAVISETKCDHDEMTGDMLNVTGGRSRH